MASIDGVDVVGRGDDFRGTDDRVFIRKYRGGC